METEKDRLLRELKTFIYRESSWLTPNDQHAIENRIDELNAFINNCYLKHQKGI